MGEHDKKRIAHTRALQDRGRRVEHDYAARIQQRAERLTEAVENSTNPIGAEIARRRRQHIELQMAQLRSDAVQARRLAEHVDSLSRRTTERTWKQTMTESSIFDAGNRQYHKPELKDKPTAGKGALTFNPLHPSMELPPEQLIRLLGMESKKTRKHMKTRRSSRRQEPRPTNAEETIADSPRPADEKKSQRSEFREKSPLAVDEQKTNRSPSPAAEQQAIEGRAAAEPEHLPPAPKHPMEYERNERPVFEQRRHGWLLPALVIGVVAGAVVAAALLLFQSPPIIKQSTPDPVATKESRKDRVPAKQPIGQQVKRKTTVDKGKSTATLRQATSPRKAAGAADDARREAAIKTEQKRLRRAAQQRLTEQLTKQKVARELAALPSPPTDNQETRGTTPLPAPPEQTYQQAAAAEPVPETVTPALAPPDASIDLPEAGVSALDDAASAGAGEIPGTRNDLMDGVGQLTASDAAPGDTAEPVSKPAPAADLNPRTPDYADQPETVMGTEPSGDTDSAIEQGSPGVADESPTSAAKDSALF